MKALTFDQIEVIADDLMPGDSDVASFVHGVVALRDAILRWQVLEGIEARPKPDEPCPSGCNLQKNLADALLKIKDALFFLGDGNSAEAQELRGILEGGDND